MNDFAHAVLDVDASAMHAESLDILTVNVGLYCNMACSHCHQESSPERTEMMSRENMATVARIVHSARPRLVDITGGAPELHPELPYLLDLLATSRATVQLRTNLTALLEPQAAGIVEQLAAGGVHVLASLPGTSASDVRAQRGDVFDRSIEALRLLRSAGYGRGPELPLDITVTPELEAPCDLEADFRTVLEGELGIPFRDLVVITAMPIGRFREQLQRMGSYGEYRQDLREAFNPDTVERLTCRSSLSVAWDGTLSDCDFNLGAGLRVADGVPNHVSEFDAVVLASRPIRFAEHCFGCTASQGSG